MAKATVANAPSLRIGLPLRALRRLVSAYQDQVAKETQILVSSKFAELDRRLGDPPAGKRPDPSDPLEQLLRLPAAREPFGRRFREA